MNITLEDVEQYKTELINKEKNNLYFEKIYGFYKIMPNILLKITLSLMILSIALFPFFGRKIIDVPLWFSIFSIVFIILIMFMESRQIINRLEKKILKGIYKGTISSILDIDCDITKAVVKPRKEEFLKLIFENKGIPGYLIVSLLNDVECFRERMEIEKQEREASNKNKEEREALISAATPIGSLLKEVSEI